MYTPFKIDTSTKSSNNWIVNLQLGNPFKNSCAVSFLLKPRRSFYHVCRVIKSNINIFVLDKTISFSIQKFLNRKNVKRFDGFSPLAKLATRTELTSWRLNAYQCFRFYVKQLRALSAKAALKSTISAFNFQHCAFQIFYRKLLLERERFKVAKK